MLNLKPSYLEVIAEIIVDFQALIWVFGMTWSMLFMFLAFQGSFVNISIYSAIALLTFIFLIVTYLKELKINRLIALINTIAILLILHSGLRSTPFFEKDLGKIILYYPIYLIIGFHILLAICLNLIPSSPSSQQDKNG